LPEAVASDANRLVRFDREAKTLAALNHPNVAAIYGLERSGGVTALVMELVEGPTLADRIADGAIPFDEALPIAKQIAEALEAAHEQGIVHRDLKPANIKVRPDGTVKALDFGLAKAMDPESGIGALAHASQAPTRASRWPPMRFRRPPGTAGGFGRQTIVSADRQRRASPLPGIPPDTYRDVRVSPDGARLALATRTDVWTYDVMRATLSRLTTNPAPDTRPLWTPDGHRIIFRSDRTGYPELFSRAADGTGSDERLLARAKDVLDLRGSGTSRTCPVDTRSTSSGIRRWEAGSRSRRVAVVCQSGRAMAGNCTS